jgi:hypothetical protein
MSAMSKHTPARVFNEGRKIHMQWLGTSRQSAQRSRLKPPRARKGLALRARRAERRWETAWDMRRFSGMRVLRPLAKSLDVQRSEIEQASLRGRRKRRESGGFRGAADRPILDGTACSADSQIAALGQPGDSAERQLSGTAANW